VARIDLNHPAIRDLARQLTQSADGPRHLVDVRSAHFEPQKAAKTAQNIARAATKIDEIKPDDPETKSELPKTSSSERIIQAAILGEYLYACLALLLGVLSIISGSMLCLYGVAGKTSLVASVVGFRANLNDAAPGVVLFVVGLFMIFVTRPRVKLGDLRG